MVKKKKKDTFQEFRSTDKSAYTTIKTTLKSVLHNHKEVQPVITNLVFEMNDLMIHSYQIHKIAKIADDFYVPLKGYASDP